MNILFLAQRVPYPPNKGDTIRSFNEIKFLSQRHDISLVCLADQERDLEHTQALQPYCQSIDIFVRSSLRSKINSLLHVFSGTPLTQAYFFVPGLQQCVRRKLRENSYDLMFIYCSSMAQYVEEVQHIPRVIDFVDVDSEKWRQYARLSKFPSSLIHKMEAGRMKQYEMRIAQSYQHCFLISTQEVKDFRDHVYACPTLSPVGVGVDERLYQPSLESYNPNSLVFTGTMDYFANEESVLYFIRHILPLIRKQIPAVTFSIVGRNPSKELQALAKQHKDIIVTGAVKQVQPYVHEAAVFVAPMRIARGVQNKILEAMAMGVPVVTTSLGFEGIHATSGKDLFVCDEPELFAENVIQLMKDSNVRKTMRANALNAVAENHSWTKNLEKLENILVELTDSTH